MKARATFWICTFHNFLETLRLPNVTCFPFFWLPPHNNRCIIFDKLYNYMVSTYHKARSDFSKCASSILKVFQLKIFLNHHTFRIKMAPKFITFKDTTSQLFAEFNHPSFETIECSAARSICCQEKCIKTIFNNILLWKVFSYHRFSSGPPSTVTIITLFSSCLSVWKLIANSGRECILVIS